MNERSTRTFVSRAILALAIAYILILQGLFASAAASSRLAIAIGMPGLTQPLCSGAQAPGEAVPGESPNHAAAQSSCCAWSASVTLDPVVPATSPATIIPYLMGTNDPIPFGQVVTTAILFRVATAQGSRAPPSLDA